MAASRSVVSPSDAWGDRTPPAVSTTPICTWSDGQASSADQVGDAKSGKSQGLGGHRRSHGPVVGARRGHTAPGSSPDAAANTSASVAPPTRVPSASTSKDWAGLRAATDVPRARNSAIRRLPTQVLPTSVPVPHTRTIRSGRTTGSLVAARAATVRALRHRWPRARPERGAGRHSPAESCPPRSRGSNRRRAGWRTKDRR